MATITIEVDEDHLQSVIGMAQSYNDDLESGLDEGIYEEGEPVENKVAIESVEQALAEAKRALPGRKMA